MTHAQPISPPRLLFGRGCRGGIVRSIQERLTAGGYSRPNFYEAYFTPCYHAAHYTNLA